MGEYGSNKIFVEGKSDKLFIDFLLKKFFSIEDNKLVVDVKGKDNLRTQPDLRNKKRIDEEAKNLIIFDTDSLERGGGRELRLKELEEIKKELGIRLEVYLLPFNDEREGELEDLLEMFFRADFKFFDDCWNNMIKCLEKTKDFKLKLPRQKAFIFSKIDLFEGERKNKWESLSVYDYTDNGIWNFDENKISKLSGLKSFIESYLFNN